MITRAVTSRVVVVLAAALLGGALAGWLSMPQPAPATDRAPGVTTSPVRGSSPPAAERARADRPQVKDGARRARRQAAGPDRTPGPGVPNLLRVPSLDLQLPVRPVGVDPAGAMGLPDTVAAAGWYRYGPRPGASRGAAVVAGHVDTAEEGIGPLADLSAVRVGARVRVDSRRGAARYVVTSVDVVSREDLDLSRLFARTGTPRLHLVTCGGAYLPEAGGYQSNVVVVAEPTARSVARSRATAIPSAG